MVTDKERSSLASLAAVSSQATRGTVPQRIKTLASLRESGKLSEVPTSPSRNPFPGTRRTRRRRRWRLRAAVRVVGGESPARGASRHGDDVAAGLAAGLDDGTADGDELSFLLGPLATAPRAADAKRVLAGMRARLDLANDAVAGDKLLRLHRVLNYAAGASTIGRGAARRGGPPARADAPLPPRRFAAAMGPGATREAVVDEYAAATADRLGHALTRGAGTLAMRRRFGATRRRARLWCVSDLHLDCPGNEGWLGTLEPRPDDALIVAGDAAVRLDALRAALETLARLYKHVVFVPGNHELWLTNASGSLDTAAHADSVAKFFAILELCDELGVWTHAVTFNGGLFFLQLNKPALAYAEQRRDALEREGNRLDVVAVSHFLPLPELFPGPLLLKAVMGCAGLQKQIDKVDCVRVAVAGHSHINFDQDIDDVRYVQLGHAERDDTGARKARDLKPALLYSARPLYA
ncbi:calcineurin-like phosphoesterase [Aureococcus anophagefferens]|nr:calcineurin-like phosphoesterase [Aureococcus anophagefferens]